MKSIAALLLPFFLTMATVSYGQTTPNGDLNSPEEIPVTESSMQSTRFFCSVYYRENTVNEGIGYHIDFKVYEECVIQFTFVGKDDYHLIALTKVEVQELVQDLSTFEEWCRIARDSSIEVSKNLFVFRTELGNLVGDFESADRGRNISLRISSSSAMFGRNSMDFEQHHIAFNDALKLRDYLLKIDDLCIEAHKTYLEEKRKEKLFEK